MKLEAVLNQLHNNNIVELRSFTFDITKANTMKIQQLRKESNKLFAGAVIDLCECKLKKLFDTNEGYTPYVYFMHTSLDSTGGHKLMLYVDVEKQYQSLQSAVSALNATIRDGSKN